MFPTTKQKQFVGSKKSLYGMLSIFFCAGVLFSLFSSQYIVYGQSESDGGASEPPVVSEAPSTPDSSSAPSSDSSSAPSEVVSSITSPTQEPSQETATQAQVSEGQPEQGENITTSILNEETTNSQDDMNESTTNISSIPSGPTEQIVQEESVVTIYEYDELGQPTSELGSGDQNSTSLSRQYDMPLTGGVEIVSMETIYELPDAQIASGDTNVATGDTVVASGNITTGTNYTGVMMIMQLADTIIYFPENLEISKTDLTTVHPLDLTIVPQEAVTQLPIKEIAIVKHISNVFTPTGIEETSTTDQTSGSADIPKEPLQDIFEFGIVGEHLTFSAPVEIQQTVPYPDGSLVEIKVYHAGDTDWTTAALATDQTNCTPQGDATTSSFLAEVQSGVVQFFTCGASTFSVTYTGGASAPNYVDNATKDFTGVVLTGVNFPTGSVIQDVNVYIDFRPINNESPTGPRGTTNCYPAEKSFLLIHPDGTSVALANAGTYTTPTTNCPQAQIYYDQSAAGGIVGGAWNLAGDSRQPVGSLPTLNGKSPFGTWTIRMGDNAGQDGVIMYGFRLDIQNVECGDGIITSPEVCDDDNTDNDDGCSALCSVEAGWTCTGTPSVCTLIPAPSGLRLHYDGSVAGGLFTDISGNGFNGTQFNGVTTGNQNGEITMCFNGTTQYIERATNLVTAYPFTMSTWMKSDTTVGLHGVVSFARSSSTNRMRNIEHNGTTIRQNAQNTTATYTNASTALNTTEWFLVSVVYASATSRTIYVNGVSAGTNTTNVTYSSNNNNRLNIGRFADSTPSNYFNGCVDDVRFYSTALTSGQIYNLYAQPASLSTSSVITGSPQLTGTIQGRLDTITLLISGTTYTGTNLGNGTWNLSGGIISPALSNGTYPVTLTVTNPYGRSVQYTSAFTVNIPVPSGDYCIAGPSSISFPQITTDSSAQTGFTSSSGYFELIDSSGADSGYYTTLQITNLSGTTTSLANTGIARQSTGITLLSGTANTGVVLGSAFASYSVASGTVTYIKRDPAPNSGKTGTYGAPLQLRITIPAYIKPDTYSGTITYTLYEN